MIYVNLFVQSNGVVAYSKLLGIGNDIYEIFFFFPPPNEYNGENKGLQKGKKKSLFNMASGGRRGRDSGQVRGCADSPEIQFRVFSCDRLIIWGICGPRKECVRFLEG